ncbi:MAG TPA: adenylate/guanylate cyclase domain-containing protein, partial [Anaerolineae bacterium]
MKCPNCSYENAAGARFCENCGKPLDSTCPNCGKPITPGVKFCRSCGFNLENAVAPASRLADLRNAAPNGLQEKMRTAGARMAGECKLVTVLFTDIVGSTALAETLDPEVWGEIVTGAHKCVSEAIYRYEGTIAQLLGDGVLAFFGAPLAHEDDAERALRAALDILASIKKYAAELHANQRVDDFQMRVGLNSGLVVVGNLGSDLHMEYLAVGDTVNLAARMQSAADPNTVLVSEHTHRLASSLFDFEDRGKITVKGKAEPIQVYSVIDERKGAVRARGIAGLTSPMVGRQREFSTLLQIISDVRGGRGSIVAVIGEAGLGKSRLIAEWRKAAFAESDVKIRWVEGRCLSYASSIAHHLSTDILRALIGVPVGSSEEETRTALRKILETLLVGEM